jgi:hypothetical protein
MVMNLGSRFFGNIIRWFPVRSFCPMVCVMPLWGTLGRAWTLLGGRKNLKPEKCL